MIHGFLRPFFINTIKMVKDSLSVHLTSKRTSDACPSPVRNYEAAVKTLNSLQTNAAVLESFKREGKRSHSVQQLNLSETEKYLTRTGVSSEQLDHLSVIHVTGTKGKGSTCAFCESILRCHGLKTGFYSSPHLVAVRERIRINGKPLSEEQFSKYFWYIYNALYERKENEHDMPAYFKFLTVMAFNVFIIENVDVAIIEVGIGGEYDCTNVLRKVPVVGITSLGMDHTNLLGKTIEEIAWQKGGILKPGADAFTVEQLPNAWDVLSKRAAERECSLKVVPSLEEYAWEEIGVKIPHSEHIQTTNASLALQLANAWLKRQKTESSHLNEESNSSLKAYAFTVTSNMLMGLCKCSWPGRFQVLHRGPVSFFLDGAHTVESINVCSQWFSTHRKDSRDCTTILLFNVSGDRDVLNLLGPLKKYDFDMAIFCPNIAERYMSASSDQANFMVTVEKQLNSSKNIKKLWDSSLDDSKSAIMKNENDVCAETSNVLNKSYFFPCVSDAVTFIEKQAFMHSNRTRVLVTGSLHLVGCVLSIIDPELSIPSQHFLVEKVSTS